MKRVAVIGAGFAGISAASYLAKAGYKVDVFEKNSQPGGRAYTFKAKKFIFEAGPSWYLMPDVFEDYFKDFNKNISSLIQLTKLKPGYKVFFESNTTEVNSGTRKPLSLGSGSDQRAMDALLAELAKEYQMVKKSVLTNPVLKFGDLNKDILKLLARPGSFSSYQRRISKNISDPNLQKVLGFMTVFMGGSPQNIPGMYAILNYIDLIKGVFYPDGGFTKLVKVFEDLAKEQGVKFHYNSAVEKISVKDGVARGLKFKSKKTEFDYILSSADYQFTEEKLLSKPYRQRISWSKKTMSPSAILFFIGLNKKLAKLQHHNLFFDTSWDDNFDSIFKHKKVPKNPLFYLCMPSKTDNQVAPKDHENLFVLIPSPAGKTLSETQLNELYNQVIDRISKKSGVDIRKHIVYKKVLDPSYFKDRYNAYQGNAFGLAHTLTQSSFFRPPIRHRNISNLYYCGQCTNPGTGVPMVVMSGKIAATQLIKDSADD
jgi:phytoene desaturase